MRENSLRLLGLIADHSPDTTCRFLAAYSSEVPRTCILTSRDRAKECPKVLAELDQVEWKASSHEDIPRRNTRRVGKLRKLNDLRGHIACTTYCHKYVAKQIKILWRCQSNLSVTVLFETLRVDFDQYEPGAFTREGSRGFQERHFHVYKLIQMQRATQNKQYDLAIRLNDERGAYFAIHDERPKEAFHLPIIDLSLLKPPDGESVNSDKRV